VNSIIKKIVSPIVGKKIFQKFFEALDRFALLGMNIGGGGDLYNSGERIAIEYVKSNLNLKQDLVLFDVGANVGKYTSLLREVFGDHAKIYSFEPSKGTFEKLISNTKDRKRLFNFGLGSKDADMTLFSNNKRSGLSSLYQRNLEHVDMKMDHVESVKIKSLDSFCDEHNIPRINFLKIDVEGYEMEVLSGSKNRLNSGAIDFIQFEFGGCNIDSRTYFKDFYYLLKDKYKIYRIVKDGLYPIDKYKEIYEAFNTTNYLAEKI